MLVDVIAQEDDPVAQQAAVYIVRALKSPLLFYNRRYQDLASWLAHTVILYGIGTRTSRVLTRSCLRQFSDGFFGQKTVLDFAAGTELVQLGAHGIVLVLAF